MSLLATSLTAGLKGIMAMLGSLKSPFHSLANIITKWQNDMAPVRKES